VSSHPIAQYRLTRLWTAFKGGGCEAPGWAIRLGVDRLGLRWTGSLMEKPAFTRANLSNARVNMAIMHVHVEELLCQAAMV
jgi:hypothetical protein